MPLPGISRAIAVGHPHPITQQGNYRQTVFAAKEDYTGYLEWLIQYSRQHKLEIRAYCLMPNHVHMSVSPAPLTPSVPVDQAAGDLRPFLRAVPMWEAGKI